MEQLYSKKRRFGNIGEDLACRYVEGRGYTIVDRNYLRKVGEIDIIATFHGKLHFIEVKTVSCESFHEKPPIRPEDNLTPAKISCLRRVIEVYLNEVGVSGEMPWQFDLSAVYINRSDKTARVEYFDNLIL